MNDTSIKILSTLNTDFYQSHGASFSETRHSPWHGWQRCLEVLAKSCPHLYSRPVAEPPADDGPDREIQTGTTRTGGRQEKKDRTAEPAANAKAAENTRARSTQTLQATQTVQERKEQISLSVFDLACGNLRFENYLADVLPHVAFDVHAVDNCDALVPSMPHVSYRNLDIIDTLCEAPSLNTFLAAPPCDLSVSFGFMHHVPSEALRTKVLSSLVRQTHPGGFVIVSFWQFLNNEAMGKKARIAHARALEELGGAGDCPQKVTGSVYAADMSTALGELDENDFLLGWQNTPGAYRYCHSFSEAEIDKLAAALADRATLISRFKSDGRSDDLNTYLIFKVRA